MDKKNFMRGFTPPPGTENILKKTGRPPKNENEKMSESITILLTKEEINKLNKCRGLIPKTIFIRNLLRQNNAI